MGGKLEKFASTHVRRLGTLGSSKLSFYFGALGFVGWMGEWMNGMRAPVSMLGLVAGIVIVVVFGLGYMGMDGVVA